jgi:hypothetical protein
MRATGPSTKFHYLVPGTQLREMTRFFKLSKIVNSSGYTRVFHSFFHALLNRVMVWDTPSCTFVDLLAFFGGLLIRDGNLGMGTWYPLGIRPDGYGYGDDFLSVGGTHTRLKPRWVRDGYFFPPTGNLMGIRYFTTAIILVCEQVKMCSFCYINYDLFWLLNFATRLSQIFVEY